MRIFNLHLESLHNFSASYQHLLESCPLVGEIGYRAFCEHPAWEAVRGCRPDKYNSTWVQ